ncbi:hypothetical protein QCB44_08290 [Thiomicrorhabdus sp. zzn3]|uniref:hypothetical protein n=1 Tax=Thiomicrorhabdus sp. zzn3 TaxID=3039775 RepID=UPI00243710E7|nr:hypothetical protein [Thiomicrorhabdus sp. zzn3]MDG6778700.1 hypothetical protein [Thiomicrorhabdus sp. zzn3]
MSDVISQIQASYQTIEDRILLKIKTHNEQVYSAWITRRYLTLLIPALQGQHPQTGETLFSNEQTTETPTQETPLDSDFGQNYQESEQADYPLGKEPILLSKITFKGLGSDFPQLNLEPESGPGIGLPLQPQILSILLKIFSHALQAADWQLELEPILQLPPQTRLQ